MSSEAVKNQFIPMDTPSVLKPLPPKQNLQFIQDEKRLELYAAVQKSVTKIKSLAEGLQNMNYSMILADFGWRLSELQARVNKLEAHSLDLRKKLELEAWEEHINNELNGAGMI